MAKIQIRHEGGYGHIEVDGVPLKGVAEATVVLEPCNLPIVEVRLFATESGMDFQDGVLKVGALHAPEALERALLAHLKAKYESDLLRLPVVSMSMDTASGPDQTAVAMGNPDGHLTVINHNMEAADPEAIMASVRAIGERYAGSR